MSGGQEMKSFLPFALPEIGEEEISEVCEALRSGWVTTGPRTKQFETEFAELMGGRNAVAVNSATAGLHLALEALGVGPGDKVATTPHTFTATAEVVRYLGADPVFVDIDPVTCNIDPAALRGVLESHDVKVILPVHFAGLPCDMSAILELSRQFGLAVVEDAAHALPCRCQGRLIGTLESDMTVFSFYATKTITTGEGGMVVTENPAHAERMRTMRLHGINRDVFDRYTSTKPAWYYEVVAPGFKYNMTDIAAALGIHQLRKVHDFRARREAIARVYDKGLQNLPLRLPSAGSGSDLHSWHLYVVRLELERLVISRDRFIELMTDAGIGTSVHFIPLHLQPYWRNRYDLKPDDFPNSHDAFRRAVSLPIYPKMSESDAVRVVEAVRTILTKYGK